MQGLGSRVDSHLTGSGGGGGGGLHRSFARWLIVAKEWRGNLVEIEDMGLGFRVQGSGFRVHCLGFIRDLGFEV